MLESSRSEVNQIFFGSSDDNVMRTGVSCTPGETFLPLIIGDLQGSLVKNFFAYVGQVYGLMDGKTTLIDASHMRD